MTDNAIFSCSGQTQPLRAQSPQRRKARAQAVCSIYLFLYIYFAAFICDDCQASPEAIIPDTLSEFRTGDSCELMCKDELSEESFVGWLKVAEEDGTLAGAPVEGEGQGCHPHHGEGPVLRRLGLMDTEGK